MNEYFENLNEIVQEYFKVLSDEIPVSDKYCVSITAKRRYIVPLVKYNNSYKRINDISDFAKNKINDYLQFKSKKYAYFDFQI